MNLKSRGPGRVRAGSSPAPGTKSREIPNLAPLALRSLSSLCASILTIVPKHLALLRRLHCDHV